MTGTNFEGKQNGGGFFATTETESLGIENPDNPGSYLQGFYWFASTNSAERGAQLGTYTNSQEYGSYNGPRPAIAAQANTTNSCLLVDTEGERLFRAIEGRDNYDNDDSTFTQFSVDNAIYFDSLVQFTVNEDEAPTIQTGDKLAVWLKGGEGTTNLMVTAGYLDPNGEDSEGEPAYVVPSNYVVNAGKDIEPGKWYRLTIEAIPLVSNGSSGYLGFRVLIDGTVVQTEQSKVSYDFHQDQFAPEEWENIQAIDTFAEYVKTFIADGANVTNFEGDDLKKLFPSLVVCGETACDTLSCVAFEGTGAVDDLTFTPNDPFGGVEPPPAEPGYVEGGVTNTCSDSAAFVAAFKSGKVLALPEGWVFDAQTGYIGPENGTAFATVPTYYNVAADGTISLNETVVKPVLGTTEGTGDDPDTEPITVGATTVTLNITNGKAGLYYGVRKYTALGGASSDTWNQTAQTADGNVTLTVDKTANATAEFYQVIVNDVLP